jgi:hypothetical protein
MYNQIIVCHGIMLVGPTSSGKTVARNILQRALSILPGFQVAHANDKSLDKSKPGLALVS